MDNTLRHRIVSAASTEEISTVEQADGDTKVTQRYNRKLGCVFGAIQVGCAALYLMLATASFINAERTSRRDCFWGMPYIFRSYDPLIWFVSGCFGVASLRRRESIWTICATLLTSLVSALNAASVVAIVSYTLWSFSKYKRENASYDVTDGDACDDAFRAQKGLVVVALLCTVAALIAAVVSSVLCIHAIVGGNSARQQSELNPASDMASIIHGDQLQQQYQHQQQLEMQAAAVTGATNSFPPPLATGRVLPRSRAACVFAAFQICFASSCLVMATAAFLYPRHNKCFNSNNFWYIDRKSPVLWFAAGCLGVASSRNRTIVALKWTLLSSLVSLLSQVAFIAEISYAVWEVDQRHECSYNGVDVQKGLAGSSLALALLTTIFTLCQIVNCGQAIGCCGENAMTSSLSLTPEVRYHQQQQQQQYMQQQQQQQQYTQQQQQQYTQQQQQQYMQQQYMQQQQQQQSQLDSEMLAHEQHVHPHAIGPASDGDAQMQAPPYLLGSNNAGFV